MVAFEAPDLDFWENECPSDCKFKQLKTVKLTDLCGAPHEMGLIKFLLANSPILEKMTIAPCIYDTEVKLEMLIELVSFRRASPLAVIKYLPGEDGIPVFISQE